MSGKCALGELGKCGAVCGAEQRDQRLSSTPTNVGDTLVNEPPTAYNGSDTDIDRSSIAATDSGGGSVFCRVVRVGFSFFSTSAAARHRLNAARLRERIFVCVDIRLKEGGKGRVLAAFFAMGVAR